MTVCVPGLAGFVDAFEEACARGDRVTLDDFLPPPDHPLRLAVLRELVCIDLEHHWLRGQAKPIEDYQRRYPELFEDHDAVREVLFEESTGPAGADATAVDMQSAPYPSIEEGEEPLAEADDVPEMPEDDIWQEK